MDDLEIKDPAFDAEIETTLNNIPVPAGLAARLKSQTLTAGSDDNVVTLQKSSGAGRSWFALAASLVVAVGLGFSVFQSRPSAADMAFHDDLIQHVYQEESRYKNRESDAISWDELNRVLAENGGHLIEDEQIRKLSIKFVNNCGVGNRGRGAHIVLEGTKGSVSVFFVKGHNVRSAFDVKDERFSGRIVPLGEGDMAIIAEKDEPIDGYQTLITEHFEWQI